jgi:hypothetical protein
MANNPNDGSAGKADPLEIAKAVVPEHLRSLGKVVEKKKPGALAGATPNGTTPESEDDAFAAEMAKRGHKVDESPDSAEVEFPESTPVGSRSTVVQVRKGKVAKKLKLGKL